MVVFAKQFYDLKNVLVLDVFLFTLCKITFPKSLPFQCRFCFNVRFYVLKKRFLNGPWLEHEILGQYDVSILSTLKLLSVF